ncbi:hypothetical protein TNCV_3053281 [Trichonephila clavipes]|uniref:Uncharacterized protein n=1 Tax=Trichonephila clavipes TaxID=2585209 RepID=A0A8X6RQ14_TRICX|nr:hypothetical protein TNCV_3053281 [Trichonephila clavipes]
MNQIISPSENGDKNSNRTCGTRKLLQWGIKSIRSDSTDCSVSSRWHHWMEKEDTLFAAHTLGLGCDHQFDPYTLDHQNPRLNFGQFSVFITSIRTSINSYSALL